MANALVVWGVARSRRGSVILRIEDHDRQRCRPAYEAALLDDLDALGFRADEPPPGELRNGRPSAYRQSDNDGAYATALALLERETHVYACDCSRGTFAAWRSAHGRPWTGPGCPGGCAGRDLPRATDQMAWRVALGGGEERWDDVLVGPRSGVPSRDGDLPIRDRHGNWTYPFCVVVDDARHHIDLVIRGEDLVDATPAQVRLGRLIGRPTPPRFLHHPLIRRSDGSKLSKSDGATGIRELLAAGASAAEVRRRAAEAIGLGPTG